MTDQRGPSREGFLSRWSRVKTEAREQEAAPPAPPATAQPTKTDDAPPELPPVEELTLESDFSGFFHPKVDEDLRRSALRKLFSDPHFNVMDGLDTYIDDYSKTEPIPPAMLAGLKQAQRILAWAAEGPEKTDEERGREGAEETGIASAPALDSVSTSEVQVVVELQPEPLPKAEP